MPLNIPRNLINCQKNSNDIIYTPLPIAKECIDLCSFEKGDIVLDPCRGNGAFYDQYPSHVVKEYCEITEGIDFMSYHNHVDWIITNPPYSVLTNFLDKIVELNLKGFGLLIPTYSLTPTRLTKLQSCGYGISQFYMITINGWFGNHVFVLWKKGVEDIVSFRHESFSLVKYERSLKNPKA